MTSLQSGFQIGGLVGQGVAGASAVLEGLPQQVARDAAVDALRDGLRQGRGRDALPPADPFGGEVLMVQRLQLAGPASDPAGGGDGQMDPVRGDVARLVDRQGGVVAQAGLVGAGPEHREHLRVAFGHRQLRESVDAVRGTFQPAAGGEHPDRIVSNTQLLDVAHRHVAVLLDSYLPQRFLPGHLSHLPAKP